MFNKGNSQGNHVRHSWQLLYCNVANIEVGFTKKIKNTGGHVMLDMCYSIYNTTVEFTCVQLVDYNREGNRVTSSVLFEVVVSQFQVGSLPLIPVGNQANVKL